MKKYMIMVLSLFMLMGCANNTEKPADKPEVEEEKVQETVQEPVQEPVEEKVDDVVEEPVEEPVQQQTSMTRDEFIIQTFADYGYDAPAKSEWILEEQGPRKVAVIIKQYVPKGRPNMSKLIFLWDGSSDSAEILFVMVNNQVKYGNDQ